MEKFNQTEVPDKLYFRVGEVSEIVGEPAYVLRFWETQFPKINPIRTPAGQRLYRKNDVELILTIKQLLRVEKFTIEGARNHLKTLGADEKNAGLTDVLLEIHSELKKIRDLLA